MKNTKKTLKIELEPSINRIRKKVPKPGCIIPNKKKEKQKRFCRENKKDY